MRDKIHLVPSAGTNLSWNAPETAWRPDECWECLSPVDLSPNICRNLLTNSSSDNTSLRPRSRSRFSSKCVWSENFIYSFRLLILSINSGRSVSGLQDELRWTHGIHPTTPHRGYKQPVDKSLVLREVYWLQLQRNEWWQRDTELKNVSPSGLWEHTCTHCWTNHHLSNMTAELWCGEWVCRFLKGRNKMKKKKNIFYRNRIQYGHRKQVN